MASPQSLRREERRMVNKIKKVFIWLVIVTCVAVPVYVAAQTANTVSSVLNAQNTFTDAFNPIQYSLSPTRTNGIFNISISNNQVIC